MNSLPAPHGPRPAHAPAPNLAAPISLMPGAALAPAAGVNPPPPIISAPPSGLALWNALRRRWMLAVLTAPTAAILVAAAIWYFMPPVQHTARAKLFITPTAPNLVIRGGNPESSLDNFRQLQIALIKNQKVLSAALRDPKLAQLPTLREAGDPLAWMEDSLTFSAPGNAEVLDVKLQGIHAEDLRLLLNAIVKNYLTEFVNTEQVFRGARRDALQKLQGELEADLHKTQTAKSQFFNKGAGNTAIAQGIWLKGDIDRIRSKVSELEDDTAKLEARLKMLQNRDPSRLPLDDRIFQEFFQQDAALQSFDEERRAASASVVDAQTKNFAASVIDRLKAKVASLERQVRERQQELRPQAEAFWRSRVAGEQVRDGATLNEELELKRSLLERHRKDHDRLLRMLADLDKNQVRLDEASLNTEATTEMLNIVRKEQRKLESEATAPPRVKELEEARVIPVDPRERKIKMAALGGGLVFVLVLAGLALWEFHGRRVESVDQIVYGLGLPLVGTVPAMPKQRLLGLAGGMNEEQVRQWRFALHEAVATARTMLLNASRTSDLRMVMITSAVAGEGKTSLSTQLAVSLAMAGYRTLLLDFDMRNPSAHKLLGMSHAPGWAEILRGELNVTDAIKTTTLENLFFVPAGDCDSVALKGLVQEELGQVLNWLRSQYDFVIVDTCPVLPVADALLLGRHMDGLIFSVLNEVSQIPKIYVATQRVAQLGIRMLGAVVNGIREDKYGYGSYGYGKRHVAAKQPAAPAQTTPKPADLNPTPKPGTSN